MKFKKAITIIFHSLVVVAFFVALVIAIIITNGYQLDFFSRNFTKTSIIDLSFDVPGAQVYLDGKLMDGVPPIKIFNVFPGEHQLEVVKEGFLTWKYEVNVQADFVSILRSYLMFPDLSKVEWEKIADLKTSEFRWINETLIKKTDLGALEFYSLNSGELDLVSGFEDEAGSLEKLKMLNEQFYVENESEVKMFNLAAQSITVLQKDFSVINYLGDYWLLDGQNYLLVYDRAMDNVLQKYDFNQTIESTEIVQKGELTFLKVQLLGERFPQLLVLRNSELKLLAEKLQGEMIVSEDNKILLMDNGQLVLFDALFNKLNLARFNQSLDLQKWIDESNFLFKRNGQLFLSDLDFKNTQVVLADSSQIIDLIIEEDQLYKVDLVEGGQQINFTSWQ